MESEKSDAPLRVVAAPVGLPVGAAIRAAALGGDPRYAATLGREFNACVGENAFKPSEVWVGPRDYDFSVTDRIVDFAVTRQMLLRGHTLVWHRQTPRWLGDLSHGVPHNLRGLLRDYIQAIVGRYQGQIAHWDVVNEAVADPGVDGAAPALRGDSLWHRALGPDYLRDAFFWAHEADPDARLYYNDSEIEARGPKSDAVYAFLQSLRASGVPVQGVGFQGHLVGGWRAGETHRANIRRFAELGLDWAITEADIRLPLNGAAPTGEQLSEQAAGYEDLTRLCLTLPRCQALVFWGFTDAYSWIPDLREGWGAALPFDENYRPKPAYHAVRNTLLHHR